MSIDMADYMLRRYHARRAEAIEILGGTCVECGTAEDLELDHIEPATKTLDLARMWSVARDRYLAELSKCQLLCSPHHREKSRRERGVDHGQGLTGKRNCRCELCRPLKIANQQQARAKASA